MPVPSTMAGLSTNEALNSPNGADPVGTSLDNYLRAYQAILRTTNAKGADIASAATTDIGAATGEFVTVTGSTTITSLGAIDAGIVRTVHFSGAPLITHNATSLILPGGKNYQVAAGDVLQFRSLGSGNWRCVGVSNVGTSSAITYVDTVADMKALTGLVDGAVIVTKAYRTGGNPWGGGTYKYNATPTGTDDGFVYHDQTTGGGQFELMDVYPNVYQAGAYGDNTNEAITTAAIQAVFDWQDATQVSFTSGSGGPVLGYAPEVLFKEGRYRISETIIMNSDYGRVVGEKAMLIKAASFTGTAAISNPGLAWRVSFVGMQFANFEKGIYLDSTNVNSGHVEIKECGFYSITDYAIHTDCQSTAVIIADCIFRSCKHELLAETGDMVVMRGGWVSRGVLSDNYDGGIVIQDPTGVFRCEDVLFVPTTQTVTEPCYIKNYGTTHCRGARFGGEGGAHSAINNFFVGTAVTQDDKRGVTLDGCEVYIGANNPAVRLFEIPSYVNIINSRGFTGTGDTAIDWSSSVSGGDQATKIAVVGTTAIRHIIHLAGNVRQLSTPSNLDYFTNKPNQHLVMSETAGSNRRIMALRSSTIAVNDVYGYDDIVGYDGSANASGTRIQRRYIATGTSGGTKEVWAAAANASTTLTDVMEMDAAGVGFLVVPTYADEAAAGAGGLATGRIYKTAAGDLRIKL